MRSQFELSGSGICSSVHSWLNQFYAGDNIMSKNGSPPEQSTQGEASRTWRFGFWPSPWVAIEVLTAAVSLLTVNIVMVIRLLDRQASFSKEHLFWVLCQPGHSGPERVSAFQRLVSEGNREWRGAQLADLNLERIDLPGRDIQQAGFQRANLARANLSSAKLNKTSFYLADLTEADLTEADLSEGQFYRAVLKGAKLRRAKLRVAFLLEVKAEGADLMAADASDADCQMANFSRATISGVNFSGARLVGAQFKGANFSLTRLDGANLKDADFTDSNWWHARGLTATQTEWLKGKFAPTGAAPEGLKEDYRKWVGGGGK